MDQRDGLSQSEESWDDFDESLVDGTRRRLGSEASDSWRPDDALLLQLRRDPEAVDAETRARVEAFFAAHPAERDAFEAFRLVAGMRRAAAPTPGVAERLRTWLVSLAPLRGGLAAAAVALLLVVGVGPGLLEPEELPLRGGEPVATEALPEAAASEAAEITLEAGDEIRIGAAELEGAPLVVRLVLSEAGEPEALRVEIDGHEGQPEIRFVSDDVAELTLPGGFRGRLVARLGAASYGIEVRD